MRANARSAHRTGRRRPWVSFFLVFTASFLTTFIFLSHWQARAQTASPQAAQAVPAAAGLVRPGDAGFGALLLNSTTPGYYVEAPLVASAITIDITGPIARTRITQRFTNPSEGWVEGIYVFPLPEDAAVDSLRMQIGARFIEGQIKERREAREIYETAKAQGYKASLVEQERPNIFTNSVANIGPGETVVVQIDYQEHVRLDNGVFSLRTPLVVAPRYSPPAEVHTVDFNANGWGRLTDPVPDRERLAAPVLRPSDDPEAPLHNPVTLTVTLRAGFELGAIKSAHHAITVSRDGTKAATLSLSDGAVAANKDFELTWAPIAGAAPQAALFRETVNGEDYLLALVVPPALHQEQSDVTRPREAVFVIDNSGSMAGPSIRQAKASLLLALDRLSAQDKFNVIRFDDTMDMVFPAPVPASARNIATAKEFVMHLEAEGGTEMLPALQAALFDPAPEDSRVRQVIFLTDGAIANEAALFAAIRAGLGRSRLFPVGIGSAPNSYFMSRAARMGRGSFTYIGDLSQVQPRMAALFEKLERPVMTDLTATWPGDVSGEAWPTPLPDLYAGEPVVLAARMSEAKGHLHITGRMDDRSWQVTLPLEKAMDGPGVAKLWARKKIASIEESRFDGAEGAAIDQAVLRLSLEHHLVSRLTSLVAVDVTPSRPAEAPLASGKVPLNLPEGWEFDKVFGPDLPAIAPDSAPERAAETPAVRRAALIAPVQLAALAVADAPAPPPPAATRGLPLPQGATEADRLILTGLLVLMLSLGLWLARQRFLSVRSLCVPHKRGWL